MCINAKKYLKGDNGDEIFWIINKQLRETKSNIYV